MLIIFCTNHISYLSYFPFCSNCKTYLAIINTDSVSRALWRHSARGIDELSKFEMTSSPFRYIELERKRRGVLLIGWRYIFRRSVACDMKFLPSGAACSTRVNIFSLFLDNGSIYSYRSDDENEPSRCSKVLLADRFELHCQTRFECKGANFAQWAHDYVIRSKKSEDPARRDRRRSLKLHFKDRYQRNSIAISLPDKIPPRRLHASAFSFLLRIMIQRSIILDSDKSSLVKKAR